MEMVSLFILYTQKKEKKCHITFCLIWLFTIELISILPLKLYCDLNNRNDTLGKKSPLLTLFFALRFWSRMEYVTRTVPPVCPAYPGSSGVAALTSMGQMVEDRITVSMEF